MQKQIEIFDPAMCCSTGVCGTNVDPKLIQAAADVETLKKEGVTVKRFNLSQDLDAFAGNNTVKALLAAHGTDILPVTLVDGVVCKEGEYATIDEMRGWLKSHVRPSIKRASFKSFEVKQNHGGCCGNDSSCC